MNKATLQTLNEDDRRYILSLEAETLRLQSLERYVQHTPRCDLRNQHTDHKCSCGLDQLRWGGA